MSTENPKFDDIITQLNQIRGYAQKLEQRFDIEISQTHPEFKKSVLNLLHYLALRHYDIRAMQKELGLLGISRLGKTESHVMAGVNAVENNVRRLGQIEELQVEEALVSFQDGKSLLETHAQQLLGKSPENRRVRIMVTFPSEASEDYELVLGLLKAGMNCARINCAHDNAEAWGKMVAHLHKAKEETRLDCKICMDLGGPKLRVGPMIAGPKVVHLSPPRDSLGKIIGTYQVWLAPEEVEPPQEAHAHLPFPIEFIKALKVDDELRFEDTRSKKRMLKIIGKEEQGFWAESDDNAYIITDTPFYHFHKDKLANETKLGEIPPVEQKILLNIGDQLLIHKEEKPGEPAKYDDQGNLTEIAHISCPLPSLYNDLRPNEIVLLDDGSIEGIVKSVSEEEILVEITYAKEGGSKLKAEKGINLPDSNLRLSGLTEKDREDLVFVVQNADVVNMSFVNNAQDVEDLLAELKKLNARDDFGIVLKIETQRAVINLPSILIAAMKFHPVGVMIARGDLAVECGWKNLAEIQEEILRLCEAAHVPNIWATQVLESLAKKGRPSRAEITDAAMSQRAECVMLNKGPYITNAIHMLDDILQTMQLYQEKKAPMLPTLKLSDDFKV